MLKFHALSSVWHRYVSYRCPCNIMAHAPACMQNRVGYRDCVCVCDPCVTGPRRVTEAWQQSVQLLPTGLVTRVRGCTQSPHTPAHGDTRSRSKNKSRSGGRNALITHKANCWLIVETEAEISEFPIQGWWDHTAFCACVLCICQGCIYINLSSYNICFHHLKITPHEFVQTDLNRNLNNHINKC